ncbi:MAG: hypothetical protein BroJett038_13780 [Chloroflexota bacterium]|nr:MAG: hypothetical protein BroJett038_13780 [Chloroflexota bacterium]
MVNQTGDAQVAGDIPQAGGDAPRAVSDHFLHAVAALAHAAAILAGAGAPAVRGGVSLAQFSDDLSGNFVYELFKFGVCQSSVHRTQSFRYEG